MLGSSYRAERDRAGVAAAAAAALVVGVLVAVPASAGPFMNGWHADSSAHTFLNPPQYLQEDWNSNISNSRVQDFDPTDLITETVTYHYNSGLTYPYVDVSWFTQDITSPGSVGCNVPVSGSSVHCDHWHMIMDTNPGLSEAGEDYVACHEIAHSVGLDHWDDADAVANNTSCVATGEDAYVGSVLTTHDKDHINGHY